jgi:predicted ArsR family transcriptional regulator
MSRSTDSPVTTGKRTDDDSQEFPEKKSLMKRCDTVNEQKIVSFLYEHEPATRSEIVEGTGVKWTTAHDCLTRLQIKGIVMREVIPRGKGRPIVYWKLSLASMTS